MTDVEAGHMHSHGVMEAPDAQDIAIDPVCGMKVDTATAKHRFEHDGDPSSSARRAAARSSSPPRQTI